MYIMCVCLFSALSRRVGALQISIIIIIITIHSFDPVSVTYDVFQLGLEVRGGDDHDRQSIVQHRLQHVGRVGCVQRQVGGACDRVTNHRQRYIS